jgi:hypothetical protein
MLLVEALAAALSGRLARLHDLAVAVGVLAGFAMVAAGLRILLAALRPPLRLIGPALRLLLLLPRPLLRLRPVFGLLVAHKYPFDGVLLTSCAGVTSTWTYCSGGAAIMLHEPFVQHHALQ